MSMLLFPIFSFSILIVSLIIFGKRKPNYNHIIHTISELGEIGAPDQRLVAWAVFLPVGLGLLPLSYLFQVSSPAVASLAGCISVGYVIASFFPCDVGSPASGSFRQTIHNLGGGIEYIGGGFSLFWAAEQFGPEFKWLGIIVLVVAAALTFMPIVSMRGLAQRIGELALFMGLTHLTWLSSNLI